MGRDAGDLVRIGMLAVIRDVQEYVEQHTTSTGAISTHTHIPGMQCRCINGHRRRLDVDALNAYLLGQLILAGGYDDGEG